MPRRYHHSRAAIHNRQSDQWDQLEPLPMPLLTPVEIRRKRIELCEEMLTLLLGDGELGARPRQTLQRIYASLGLSDASCMGQRCTKGAWTRRRYGRRGAYR
jgi:hypothetical protein